MDENKVTRKRCGRCGPRSIIDEVIDLDLEREPQLERYMEKDEYKDVRVAEKSSIINC